MQDDSTTPRKTCTKCGVTFPATVEFFYRQPAGRYGVTSWCRTCDKQWHKSFREAHREEIRDYQATHRDDLCAYLVQYRIDNHDRLMEFESARRESHLAWKKGWYADNRDEILAKDRARYAADPIGRARHSKDYARSHPEWNATNGRNRRAAERNAPGSHTAADVRAQYDRQKGRCYWCGEKVTFRGKHVDHVMPIALGGSNGPENLVIACAHCNTSKGSKHPMDWAGRLC